MNEEISKILKMVEEGKISADKAQELIEAIGDKKIESSSAVQLIKDSDIMNKMLKIKVNSHEGDVVNVNLPIKFIKTMLKTVGKIPMETYVKGMENVDLNLIADAIDNGISGKIIDVNSADGDIVEVTIE